MGALHEYLTVVAQWGETLMALEWSCHAESVSRKQQESFGKVCAVFTWVRIERVALCIRSCSDYMERALVDSAEVLHARWLLQLHIEYGLRSGLVVHTGLPQSSRRIISEQRT
jgi:hypothetical protein